MTSTRSIESTRHHQHTLREDHHMSHIELRLADVAERQLRFRSIRDDERSGLRLERSLRRRLGQSLVRLGRRVGGDAMTAPAWQG
jgi:hypothetical protein